MNQSEIQAVLRLAYYDAAPVLEASRKRGAEFASHRDWPWNGMILSGATLGGSKRWQGVQVRYDKELSWDCLTPLSEVDRHNRLLTVGRYKNRTAAWLNGVFKNFVEFGGPASVRSHLNSLSAHEVIGFWCSFRGMGDKYARNIMMDADDPRFRNGFFAIDSRISSLLKQLGYSGPSKYASQERFLNNLAATLEIDSWLLDRLLYQNASDIAVALSGGKGGNLAEDR